MIVIVDGARGWDRMSSNLPAITRSPFSFTVSTASAIASGSPLLIFFSISSLFSIVFYFAAKIKKRALFTLFFYFQVFYTALPVVTVFLYSPHILYLYIETDDTMLPHFVICFFLYNYAEMPNS